jgi:hypothetical protein
VIHVSFRAPLVQRWAAARIRELDPAIEIVVCTAYSDVDPRDIGAMVPPGRGAAGGSSKLFVGQDTSPQPWQAQSAVD